MTATAHLLAKAKPTPTPDPASTSPDQADGPGVIFTIFDWALAHPLITLIIAATVSSPYWWGQFRQYRFTRGKLTPPLGASTTAIIRYSLIEDIAPVLTRPAFLARPLQSVQGRHVLAVTVAILGFAIYTGNSTAFLAAAALAAILYSRGRRVFRSRHSTRMQMFNVASGEFHYPREYAANPWAYVNITRWEQLVRPAHITVTFPAQYHSEDLTARERFERNFSGSVSDEHSFEYEWESARNRVTATPTPYLPRSAPYTLEAEGRPWNEIPLGLTWGGKPAVLDVSMSPHTLVSGGTGTGKSVTQRVMLAHLLASPEWRVLGIDPKMVELGGYEHHANMLQIATTLEKATALLESTEQEMRRRYEEMSEAGVAFFRDLPPDPETGFPVLPLMVIIDEVYDLLATEGIKSEEGKERDAQHARCSVLIGSIARLGRAAGVHLILATQRPDATVLKGEIKNNLAARIACGRMDLVPSQMILDSDKATRLPLIKGRAILRMGSDFTEYQGFWLPMDQFDGAVAASAGRYAGLRVAGEPGDTTDGDADADGGASVPSTAAMMSAGDGQPAGWWARQKAKAAAEDAARFGAPADGAGPVAPPKVTAARAMPAVSEPGVDDGGAGGGFRGWWARQKAKAAAEDAARFGAAGQVPVVNDTQPTPFPLDAAPPPAPAVPAMPDQLLFPHGSGDDVSVDAALDEIDNVEDALDEIDNVEDDYGPLPAVNAIQALLGGSEPSASVGDTPTSFGPQEPSGPGSGGFPGGVVGQLPHDRSPAVAVPAPAGGGHDSGGGQGLAGASQPAPVSASPAPLTSPPAPDMDSAWSGSGGGWSDAATPLEGLLAAVGNAGSGITAPPALVSVTDDPFVAAVSWDDEPEVPVTPIMPDTPTIDTAPEPEAGVAYGTSPGRRMLPVTPPPVPQVVVPQRPTTPVQYPPPQNS